jgi:transposase InsO family protein
MTGDLMSASRDLMSEKVLDKKHEADQIMIEELSKINPSCFREKFAKWIAEKAMSLKLKLGMKLVADPLYSTATSNLLIDAFLLQAKRDFKNNRPLYPDDYLEEMNNTANKLKTLISGGNIDKETYLDFEEQGIVDKFMNDYNKDVKEYDDYKAEEERKAREVSFIDRLTEIIDKPMKYFTDWTFGQIPVIKDYLTYDKLKGAIGVKSKWEYREEAEQLDSAIEMLENKIEELEQQGKTSSTDPELAELWMKSSALRNTRKEYKHILGYALPILKSLRTKLASELHSPITHKFVRRSVFINALDDTWSSDLIFLPHKDNGYKGILTVIDNFSKFGWAVPIKTKTNAEMIDAFQNIFTTSNRKPKRLWTDKGSEFYGAEFKLFLLKHNIKLYSTESELKSVIIERWNRTLKEKMYRKFTELDDDKSWVNILPVIVEEYNNANHSAHKMSPVEASKPENEGVVKKRLHSKMRKYTSKLPKYKEGDKVRIYSYKYLFDKGYKKNFTDEVFEISEVHKTVPWTYSIKDSTGEVIQGKMYENEMIHTDFDFNNKLVKNKLYNF